MNIYKIIPLLLLVSSSVFAAGDELMYYLKVTITTKEKKVITGYFESWNIKIYNNDAGYYYSDEMTNKQLKLIPNKNALIINEREYNFFNYVKRNLYDTISIYKDAAFRHGQGKAALYNMPLPIGPEEKLAREQIDKITIHALYGCSSYVFVRTKIESEDKMWINNVPSFEQGVGGHETCYSTVICFNTRKENAAQILRLLIQLYKKENDLEAMYPRDEVKIKAAQNKVSEEIQRLRKLKILVYETCSC